MDIVQSSKLKVKNYSSKLKVILIFSITLHFALCTLHSPVHAVATKDGLRTAYNSQDNRFLMVWSDGRNSSGGVYCYESANCNPDVYGVFMDAGQNVSSSFPIAETTNAEHYPEIAYNPQKNEYLVVYQRRDSDYNIYSLRLNNLGQVIKQTIICDDQYDQWEPSVIYDSVNNRYLVAFMGLFSGVNGKAVKIQLLDADGNKIGSLKTISLDNGGNVATGKHERPVGVFIPGEQKYLLVWENEGLGGRGTVLDKDANIIISPKNFFYSQTANRVIYPQISYNSFLQKALIVWQENIGSAKKIKALWLNSGGQKVGSEIIFDENAGANENPRPGVACDNSNDSCLVGWFNWIAYSAKLQFVNQNEKIGSLIDGVSSRPSLTFNPQQRYFLAVSTNNPLQFKRVTASSPQPTATPPAGGSPTSTPPSSSSYLDLETDFEGTDNFPVLEKPPILVKIIAKATNFLTDVILKDKIVKTGLPLSGLTIGRTYDFIFSAFPFLNSKKSISIKQGHNPESPTLIFGPMKTGDLNADNQINGLDWSLMKLNFGESGDE